jgi:hypothetical protein
MSKRVFFTVVAMVLFISVTIGSKGIKTMERGNLYVILSIKNGNSLRYKNKVYFRGDTIALNDNFKVANDQVVVLKNTKDQTKKIVKGKEYNQWKCKNLFNYLFPRKRRIIRDNEPEEHLRTIIGEELLWTDSLCINTTYNPNDQRYYVMEVLGDSTNVGHFLPSDISRNINILFTKEVIWGNEEPKELFFNLRVGYGRWYDYKQESEIIIERVKLTPLVE